MARSAVWTDDFVTQWLLRANVEVPVELVCDVGAGWGRFGLPIRNLFPRVHLIGMDLYDGFPRPELAENYDEWFTGDALKLYPQLGAFDVTLMCDVVEHMSKLDGLWFIGKALAQSRYVVVTTPLGYMRQGPVAGNVYEEHLSVWWPWEFEAAGAALRGRILGLEVFVERLPRCFGVLLGGNIGGQSPRGAQGLRPPERVLASSAEQVGLKRDIQHRQGRVG